MSPAVSDPTPGFPPIAGADALVLVLGSLPSRKSVELGQYYGHPQNAFWRIMGELFGAHRELPYDERREILAASRVAVWDVLASSVRPGSMDADIDASTAIPNDFDRFFDEQTAIELVCFNGRTAEKLFRQHVAPRIENRSNKLRYQLLPSTSPAYASMNFDAKLRAWRILRDTINTTGEGK
jgi:hypoxanthine-DNA glycosylase